MIPCCLCHLNFTVAIPEDELIQVRTQLKLTNSHHNHFKFTFFKCNTCANKTLMLEMAIIIKKIVESLKAPKSVCPVQL